MNNAFFEHPILNSPYEYPRQYWELDETGQPTQRIIPARRPAEFITPIPKPKKRKGAGQQAALVFDEGKGLSTKEQQYAHTAMINGLRQEVDKWRMIPNPGDWRVTHETARLLQHWRHHAFSGVRPFFCQIEAAETAIWLAEVAPQLGKAGARFLEYLANANNDANPGLSRLALKLATGAGKTTVMAMLIAWQTVNAVRHPGSRRFTRGFLVVTPGLTIKDRLRVLLPNDPDSYLTTRELIPNDMLDDIHRAKIVITNYHAFKRRERMELSKGGRALLQGRARPSRSRPCGPSATRWKSASRACRATAELVQQLSGALSRFPRVQGYRVELPDERLAAKFTEDSVLELSPDLVGPSITRNQGIIGEAVDLNLEHLEDLRPSTILLNLTRHLLYNKWRDPGEEPKLHLFGQLKRITRQWLDTCLVCKGNTHPGLLMYQELADMACNRITAAITREFQDRRPIKALLDPYNPTGSTTHVRFTTTRAELWDTAGPPSKCHVNRIVLDSDWEAEFCRVAESHPQVRTYVKNHNLGLEVPYRYGSEVRQYWPDFVVLVDDGRGPNDLLHLVVEIKGYRREDAKDKKTTMETYWVPGVNNLKSYGRWAFAEFGDVYEMDADFKAKVQSQFDEMIESAVVAGNSREAA